ncbi:MAG: alpha/beta hydrolase [Planctomycetota bacterium]|jgi:hypothetical protein|nr:alpha/beta hydrolase [Planctomycetota bacterium]MDP6929139.1 alpha/beta hydrolase [Planctomycetota bacterium]
MKWPWNSLLVCIALLGPAGCVAPLVQSAGESGPSALEQLEGPVAIAVDTGAGTMLRGLHLRAAAEPPLVVLHLLPSGASVTTGMSAGIGRHGIASTLTSFARFGCDSVVIDYRGLGDSDAPRDASALLEDGRAMWRKAVELAGGRSDRVVIRAASIGTLIAADLLAAGHHPAAVILIAPVRASTITYHGARVHYGAVAAWFADLLYRTVPVSDLETVLAATRVPVLLVLPDRDIYLPPVERRLIEAAATSHRVIDYPGDHHVTVRRMWGFTIDPESMSGRATPELIDAEREFLRRWTRR